MKAAIRNSLFGFNLAFKSDQPEPKFCHKGSKQVLIQVQAGAINPVDYKLPKAVAGAVLGIDFCGTIKEVGDQVKDFKVGDLVFGGTSGSLADFTVTESSKIAKVPTHGWTAAEAAALPVAYQSCLQGLRKGGVVPAVDKQAKESVLVIGASGGCGLAALQLCKAMKIPRIVAICSGKNKDLVTSHGATEMVDYTIKDELETFFGKNQGTIDCVFDVATGSGDGEDYIARSLQIIKPQFGKYVALNGPATSWLRAFTGLEKSNQAIILCEHNTKDLLTVVSLLDSIQAKPLLEKKEFNENSVSEGYEMLKSRRTKGKIVFTMA